MPRKKIEVRERVNALGICHTANVWMRENQHKSAPQLWKTCARGDWMLWLAASVGVNRRVLIGVVLPFVKHALKQWPEEGNQQDRATVKRALDDVACLCSAGCLKQTLPEHFAAVEVLLGKCVRTPLIVPSAEFHLVSATIGLLFCSRSLSWVAAEDAFYSCVHHVAKLLNYPVALSAIEYHWAERQLNAKLARAVRRAVAWDALRRKIYAATKDKF